MATKVLVVLDDGYRFAADPAGVKDFTYTALVGALEAAGFDVDRAHRNDGVTRTGSDGIQVAAPIDPTADITSFKFDSSANLLDYDVIWMIGLFGRNVGGVSGTFDLTGPELAAIARFMDAGGGVFATGDHDSIGSDMSGRVLRVRAARCWYGSGDGHSPMPATFPRNFAPLGTGRADTTQPNPAGTYSAHTAPFVWFENQSDAVPQPIVPASSPAHPILRKGDADIVVYPDHMHEGLTLGQTELDAIMYDYGQTVTFDGEDFIEFPTLAGETPKPQVIATGTVRDQAIHVAASGGGTDSARAAVKPVNTLSAYDGRRAGVGRVVTGSTFHHYVDINLTGDFDINTPALRALTGPDAEKGHGFNDAPVVFGDIKTVFVNITNWLARPRPKITLILERSTFGEDEAAINPQFAGAILVTVDGLKPGHFPGGPISTTSPSAAQLLQWAPAITLSGTGSNTVSVVPTGVATDDPTLAERLQRFTFTYRVELAGNAFTFPQAQSPRQIGVAAALTPAGAAAPLTDQAVLQLVKSANPFMLDLEGDNDTHWLSSDLKVFKLVAGNPLFGVPLPANATRAQALTFINTLSGSITPAQFESLTGGQAASALSPLPTTTESGANVYNFAIARVRRIGNTLAAADVRVFFRIFTSQTTAALTYLLSGSTPTEGYLKTATAPPIPLPGQSGGEWLSFPCFAETRAATPAAQTDGNNVKPIPVSDNNKFFGALLDTNLSGGYLPATPGGMGAAQDLPGLLAGEHQCLVAQIEFAPVPIPSGATPWTSDKLAQRNIALSEVANPGLTASRCAFHTFEIEATPNPVSDGLPPDELLLDWSENIPEGSRARLHIPGWDAHAVIALADRLYARHELIAIDQRTIEVAGGGMRWVPLPQSLRRQTGVLTVELPLGIRKGQRFDLAVRQITNRGRNVAIPQPTLTRISLTEAAGLLTQRGIAPATATAAPAKGVFDLGDNRSLITDLAVIDAHGDFAVLVKHPDPKKLAAALAEARLWRETVGAFQLGIPVSVKRAMKLDHMRLFSLMSWRLEQVPRHGRWRKTMEHYVGLLADKVQALGGNPWEVPATPDGAIPQLPWVDGDGDGDGGGGSTGGGNPIEELIRKLAYPWGCLLLILLALLLLWLLL